MRQLATFLCVLGFFAGCLHAENILLVSVDTLRADRLGCYGYRANRTPAVDRWAAEGIRFEKAYSEYPLTLPAHATLMTGRYPFGHGIRENVGFSLAREQLTLAEVLKTNGFATAGFIGSYVLASQFGISQGFDFYEEQFGTSLEKAIAATALRRSSEQVTDAFLTWLDRHRAGRFLAFVHFYDPHAPCPNGYDAEVARVDRSVARIDAYLRKWNLLDKTHIVLVSDHGESLGEHGESGHGFFLYDSTLHVPLIVRPAAGFPASSRLVKSAVSLADVMPTILQMAGIDIPGLIQGKSLVRLMIGKEGGDAAAYAETFVPQLQFGWSPLRSYRLGKYKWIEAPRPELYDTDTDPGEKVNLFPDHQALAGQYRQRLDEFLVRNQGSGGENVPAGPVLEANERLAALGYIRLGTMKPRGDFGRGMDPKDRIAVFENYHGLLYDIATRNISGGMLPRIEAIRRQAPELKGVAFLEAKAFEALGRPQEAEAKYRQGLAEEPENLVARAEMAGLLIRQRKMAEAERELQQVLAGDPGDYRSRNNLAGIYSMKGRPDAALAELKQALAVRPSYAAGWNNMGRIQMQLKNWRDAEAAFRKAVILDRTDASAHFLLAQVLRTVGKQAEADRYMQLALQLDPNLARRAPAKAAPPN